MKRRKNHTKRMIFLLVGIEILLLLGFVAYLQVRPMVVKVITREAGAEMPDVKDFLLHKKQKASFVTNTQELNNPGTYEIKIKIGRRTYTSSLHIIDTIAPTATVIDKMVLKGEDIKPMDFLTDIKDAADVTLSFINAPDSSKLGEQKIKILLEDSSKNRTELEAVLTILDIKNTVTIEAGSVMNITINDFVENDKYDIAFVTDLRTLDISKVAVHKIILNVDGREISSNIEVIDTTAPKATFINREIWQGDKPDAMSFVTSLLDASEVTATFMDTPDFTRVGTQNISIELKDASGNRTQGQVSITLKVDIEPPRIIGTRNKTVYIGDAVAYKKGVSVTDNRDQDLTVKIDSSTVNLKKEGIYNVIYTAKDTAGNQSTVNTTVTVIKFTVSEDMVNAEADKVLAKIITQDMTKLEKAKEIYNWVHSNVGYTGESDKSDWLAEAYRGITKGVGDCFTYYAVSQALLTRADIENMRVTRVGGRTQHFWNLINCGSGWYHFDTCRHIDHKETFMMTDKEVEEYTKLRGNNYYTFDKTLYPATPEK